MIIRLLCCLLVSLSLSSISFAKVRLVSTGTGKVYVLAMGANAGGLKRANQDASKFANTLQSLFPLPKEQVRLYSNATTLNFKSGMEWLFKKAKANDTVFIFFSGHGVTVKDKSGDEADGLDEAFVMSSSKNKDRITDKDLFLDDEFSSLVKKLKTSRVISVLDACFSGGLHRAFKYENEKFRSKKMITKQFGNKPSKKNSGLDYGNKGVFISASKEGQDATEGSKGGTLTYYLTKALKNPANKNQNWNQILNTVIANVKYTAKHRPTIVGNKHLLNQIKLVEVP